MYLFCGFLDVGNGFGTVTTMGDGKQGTDNKKQATVFESKQYKDVSLMYLVLIYFLIYKVLHSLAVRCKTFPGSISTYNVLL